MAGRWGAAVVAKAGGHQLCSLHRLPTPASTRAQVVRWNWAILNLGNTEKSFPPLPPRTFSRRPASGCWGPRAGGFTFSGKVGQWLKQTCCHSEYSHHLKCRSNFFRSWKLKLSDAWHWLPSGTKPPKFVACSEAVHLDLLKILPWNLFFSSLGLFLGEFFDCLHFHLQKMQAPLLNRWTPGKEASQLHPCTAWEEGWWGVAPRHGDRDHRGSGCGKLGTSEPTRQCEEMPQAACWGEEMGQGCLSIQVTWARAALSCGFEGHGSAKPPLLCFAKRRNKQSN